MDFYNFNISDIFYGLTIIGRMSLRKRFTVNTKRQSSCFKRSCNRVLGNVFITKVFLDHITITLSLMTRLYHGKFAWWKVKCFVLLYRPSLYVHKITMFQYKNVHCNASTKFSMILDQSKVSRSIKSNLSDYSQSIDSSVVTLV